MTIRKAYAATVEALGDRSIRAICSTADVDMTGEVVQQDGADLSVYQRNPIVLFAHNPEHPVGTASNVRVDNGKLVADIEFAAAGISPKADEICALVKSGVLKSISIGFDPTECEPMNPSRPRGPQRYIKWTLCEISVVSIPANTNAVITDKAYSDAGESTMPRSTAKKAVAPIKLKGLHEIGRLAAAMDMVGWQHDCSCWEQALEGDASELPGKLAEIMHMMGEALIAMTAEEVGECLAAIDTNTPDMGADPKPDMVKIVQESVSPLVAKFRSGFVTKDDDEEMAMPSAAMVKASLDSHDMLRKAMNFHGQCVKSMCEACASQAANQNGAGDGQVSGKARKPSTSKAPAIAPPTAALVQGLNDSHSMLKKAMNFHTSCMKKMGAVADPEDEADNHQTQDGDNDKALDLIVAKEQRMRRARALALRHPPE